MEEFGKVYMYSLYDRKLREFSQLAVARNDETIRRNLLDGIKGSGSLVEKHPEDFDLFRLGTFYQQSGVIAGLEGKPVLVCNCEELMSAHVPPKLRAEA